MSEALEWVGGSSSKVGSKKKHLVWGGGTTAHLPHKFSEIIKRNKKEIKKVKKNVQGAGEGYHLPLRNKKVKKINGGGGERDHHPPPNL